MMNGDPAVGIARFMMAGLLGPHSIDITNHTGGTVDLASGTIRADVWKH